METVLAHPAVAEVRQVVLATADAHGLYERSGFTSPEVGRYMVLRRQAG